MVLKGFNYAQTCLSYDGYMGKESDFDLAKKYGASQCRLLLAAEPWNNNTKLQNGMYYRDHVQQVAKWIKDRGMYLHVCNFPIGTWYPGLKRWEIISTPSLSDWWINTCVEMTQFINPDAMEVMSEPPSGNDFYGVIPQPHATVVFPTYWSFIDRAIKQIKAANRSVNIHVASAPFWDLSLIAAKPWNYDNLTYEMHQYQQADPNVGCYGLVAAAWQNNNDEEAKRLYKKMLLTSGRVEETGCRGHALQAIRDLRLPLFCGECGCASGKFYSGWSPRWLKYHYDLMKELGIGWSQAFLRKDPHPEAYGMLDATGTELNEIGKIWAQNVGGNGTIPPTPGFPVWTIPVVLVVLVGLAAVLKKRKKR